MRTGPAHIRPQACHLVLTIEKYIFIQYNLMVDFCNTTRSSGRHKNTSIGLILSYHVHVYIYIIFS